MRADSPRLHGEIATLLASHSASTPPPDLTSSAILAARMDHFVEGVLSVLLVPSAVAVAVYASARLSIWLGDLRCAVMSGVMGIGALLATALVPIPYVSPALHGLLAGAVGLAFGAVVFMAAMGFRLVGSIFNKCSTLLDDWFPPAPASPDEVWGD
jgi:hypothetical protein